MSVQKNNKSPQKLAMTGVVLAGGQSSRMKTNKAFLEMGGKLLIERSLAVLEGVFAEVLISANDIPLYQRFGKQVVPDIYKGQGPLGGLHAAMQRAAYDVVFFVACDMPFINEAVIRYLARKTGDYDIVVPSVGGRVHTLHGFYHRKCLPVIDRHLQLGKRKLAELFSDFDVCYVGEAELAPFGDLGLIFANANTPEEFQALKQREVSIISAQNKG